MKYITTRIALEAFEFQPGVKFPEWFDKMIVTGRAHVYGETAKQKACVKFGDNTAYVGWRVYIDETGHVGVYSPERFARCCQAIDMSRDAAGAFIDRLNDAIFNNERK